MGLQAHAFYGVAPIFMCFLFTYGLMRMQWETIQDLKDGLEEKSCVRTKELQEALTERNLAFAHLNQELAEAAEYVRSILPHPISHGEIRIDWKFVPSASLGGDAFGYFRLDEDHFVICLIDVSGHGVGTASFGCAGIVFGPDELMERKKRNKTTPSRSKPDRGVLFSFCEMLNQKREVVATMMAMNLIRYRGVG